MLGMDNTDLKHLKPYNDLSFMYEYPIRSL